MKVQVLYEEIRKYYTRDDKEMSMKIIKPTDWSPQDQRTCIVFYFGGGFVKRNIKHFQMQAEYFSSLGAVCIVADYQLAQEGNGLETCHQDAMDVLQEVMNMASELGINTTKVIVCGGSAGGALACWSAMRSQIPCAQILFNPVLFFGEQNLQTISHKEIIVQINDETTNTNALTEIQELWGNAFDSSPERFSAYHMLDEYKIPPTLLLQGTYDPIAYAGVVLFHQKAQEKKYDCKTILYQGESHGFFNYDKIDNKFCYYDTLHQMEAFLKDRGLL